MATTPVGLEKGILTYTTLRQFLGFAFFTLIFGLLFYTAIRDSFQQHSFEPLVNEIGQRVVQALNALNTEAIKLMNNPPTFSGSNFFSSLWGFYNDWNGIIAQLFIISIWFKLVLKAIRISPLNAVGDNFKEYLMTFIFFIVLQLMFSLAYRGDTPVTTVLSLPFESLFNVVKLIPILLDPIVGGIGKFYPTSNASSVP